MMIRTVASRSALAALGLIVAVSLSGCLSPGGDTAPPSEPPRLVPTESNSSTPSPTETPAPDGKATPISIPCNTVINPQSMYDFNPNFGLLANFAPEAGSLAAQAVIDRGTVCRWINQTSGDTIDVSISQPSPKSRTTAESAAESGTSVGGLGDAAYFSQSGKTGVVQIFVGNYWVTVSSVYFSSAGDAQTLAETVLSSLP
ncbi:MAG: arginyl-tRNA synthetase [Terrimesophilobacter sp.]